MMSKYSNKERKGLPGGPNEQFSYVTGFFMQSNPFRSMIQYQDGSEVNPPYNYIDRDFGKRFGKDSSVLGYDNNTGVFIGERLPEAQIVAPTSLLGQIKSDYAKLHPLPEGVKWGANTLEGDPRLAQEWLSNRNAYIYERMRDIPQQDLSTTLIDKNAVEDYMNKAYEREIEMLSTPEGLYRLALSIKDEGPSFRDKDSKIKERPPINDRQGIVTFSDPAEESYYLEKAKKRLDHLKRVGLKTESEDIMEMRGFLAYYSPTFNNIVLRNNYPSAEVFAHEMNHAIGKTKEKWQDRYLRDNIEFENSYADYMLKNADELTAYLRGARAQLQQDGYIEHPYEYITANQLKEAYDKFSKERQWFKEKVEITDDLLKRYQSRLENFIVSNNMELENRIEAFKTLKNPTKEQIEQHNNEIKNIQNSIEELKNIKNDKIKLKDFFKDDLAKPKSYRPYRFFKAMKPTEENFKHLEKVINSLADNSGSNTYDDFAKFGKELKPKRRLKKAQQEAEFKKEMYKKSVDGFDFFRSLKNNEKNWETLERALQDLASNNEQDDGTRMAQKGTETKKHLKRAQRGGIMYDEEGMPMYDGNNSISKKTVPPRKGVRKNPDGSHSTHLMAAETFDGKNWVVFPTLFQNPDGSWIDMSNEPREKAFQEAEMRGEVIDFGTDKDSALNFGKGSWKKEKPRSNSKGQILFEDDYTSTEGYKRNSPDRFNPYNIIPSGNITMEGVDFPILGIDNYGNEQVMTPGSNYTFPGDTVLEFPIAQRGAETGSYDYSKNLDFETMSQYANEVGMPYAWRQFNDAEKALYRKVMRQFNFKGQPVDVYNPNGVNAEYYTDADGERLIQSAPIPSGSIEYEDGVATPIDTGVYIKEWNDSNESRPKNKGMAADWDKRRDEYVVSRILEDNPTLLERDVEAMNKLSKNAQKFLATDERFQQSYWQDMVDGMLAFGAPAMANGTQVYGMPVAMPMPSFDKQKNNPAQIRIDQIQSDPNKTDYEKEQLIGQYQTAPILSALGETVTGAFAPYEFGTKFAQGLYRPDYSVIDALAGKRTQTEDYEQGLYDVGLGLATMGAGPLVKNLAKRSGKAINKMAKRQLEALSEPLAKKITKDIDSNLTENVLKDNTDLTDMDVVDVWNPINKELPKKQEDRIRQKIENFKKLAQTEEFQKRFANLFTDKDIDYATSDLLGDAIRRKYPELPYNTFTRPWKKPYLTPFTTKIDYKITNVDPNTRKKIDELFLPYVEKFYDKNNPDSIVMAIAKAEEELTKNNKSLLKDIFLQDRMKSILELDLDDVVKRVNNSQYNPVTNTISMHWDLDKNLDAILEHELGHGLSTFYETEIDKRVKNTLKPEFIKKTSPPGTYKGLTRGEDEAINRSRQNDTWYMFGSRNEPTAFMRETRQNMLEDGFIDDIFQPITPEIVERANKYYTANYKPSVRFLYPQGQLPLDIPRGRFFNSTDLTKARPDVYSTKTIEELAKDGFKPARTFGELWKINDFYNKDNRATYEFVADLFNRLPQMALPTALGAGAIKAFMNERSAVDPSTRIGLPTYQQRGETPKYDFTELAERLNASYDPQYGWDYSVLTKDELKFYTDYYNKNIRKVDGESATGNSSRIDITQSEPETDLLYNTNQIQNLPLVTVTATRMKAAKHADDYEKKNPRPKRKQTLESTNWRKAMGLKDYDLIEWEKDRNRYVANQVAEDTGITERDVEAMNQITPLEEEYLLTQNKYQPSLYQDFTEGLETIGTGLSSLSNPYLAAQPFSQRRATQIMNSDNLTEREKQSKAAGYLSNPGISAFGDAMGVLSPLDVGVKALQAPFVDDYTIGDALSGTRNDVNPAIDMLMGTVTGAAGAKLAGKMARGIGKGISRNLQDVSRNISNAADPDIAGAITRYWDDTEAVSPIIRQPDAVKAKPENWQLKELPGLHLKSTMEGGAISKIVEPKTGLINTEQAIAIIGKESGGADKVALIRQALGDNIPKKMDYNEFRKLVQDQLIPLERQFSTQTSHYGIEDLGYDNFNRPLENQTLILGNKSKFGIGSPAHANPTETLGHVHFLRDSKTPNVLTVTQIQSDAFQGRHRIMPRIYNKEKALETLAYMEDIVKRQDDMVRNAKQLDSDTWVLPNGTKISNSTYEYLKKGGGQLEINAMKKAEIENFTQKALLDKNHETRYLQEIIDYAGKRGDVDKVRLPTSETAAKVQGFIPNKKLNRKLYDAKVEELKSSGKYTDEEIRKMSMKLRFNPDYFNTSYPLEEVTILKKYSKLPKTIKKLFGKEPAIVTDSNGNTWYEFDIPDKFKTGKGEIMAYQEGGSVDTFRGSIYDQPIGTSRRMLKQRGGEVKLFKYQQPFKGTTYTSPYDIF